MADIDKEWDVFISHASEDKETIAKPIASALSRCGLRIWLDEQQLRIGDSLRRKIDEGLAKSRFGVVILSQKFFAKEWPQKELDALVSREEGDNKVILPIWHGVSRADVASFSPLLAAKLAIPTSVGLDKVVEAILRAIFHDELEVESRLARYSRWDTIYIHGVVSAIQLGEFEQEKQCKQCDSKGLLQVVMDDTNDWYVGETLYSYCTNCDYLEVNYLDREDSFGGKRPPGIAINPDIYKPQSFNLH